MLFGSFFNWLANFVASQVATALGAILASFNVVSPAEWTSWTTTAKTYWNFANYFFPADMAMSLLAAWFVFLGLVASLRWFLKFIPFMG